MGGSLAEVGSIVEGTVNRLADFGAFIQMENGETGLVHISEVDKNYVKDIKEHLKEGDKVSVKVVAIKEDGKIDLSIKQADPSWEDRPQRRGDKDPEFEAKLKRFMRESQERLADVRRQRDSKRQ
ncbi:MAG: S1 RNA-binding domain-containing protein [Actinomycetota bacterium]|nr:S1 RNA-binding domain-containing protein [Actinomycetota bacterium]